MLPFVYTKASLLDGLRTEVSTIVTSRGGKSGSVPIRRPTALYSPPQSKMSLVIHMDILARQFAYLGAVSGRCPLEWCYGGLSRAIPISHVVLNGTHKYTYDEAYHEYPPQNSSPVVTCCAYALLPYPTLPRSVPYGLLDIRIRKAARLLKQSQKQSQTTITIPSLRLLPTIRVISS